MNVETYDKIIAANLDRLRKERGLTLKALSDVLGFSYQQAQKYSSGQNSISAAKLKVLGDFMKVPMEEFFGISEILQTEDDCLVLEVVKVFRSIQNNTVRKRFLDLMKTIKTLH